MVRIVAVLTFGIHLISACSSPPEPNIETVSVEITSTLLPTKQPTTSVVDTPTPPPVKKIKEPFPTPIPTNTPMLRSDKYPDSLLVHPSDLILEGYFVASDWIECPGSLFENEEYFDIDYDTILNTASVTYFTETCEITISRNFSFSERIYLFESSRQATQFAEKLTVFTEMYASDGWWGSIQKNTSANIGENPFWKLRKLGGTDWLYIVMVKDDAVMISELATAGKLVQEDKIDLSAIMLQAFERSQSP